MIFIKNRIEFVKVEREKAKENKQNKEDKDKDKAEEEDSPLEARGKAKIINGNEIPEEPDKQIIKNIDELKKTAVTETENKGEQSEETKKEEPVINHNYE